MLKRLTYNRKIAVWVKLPKIIDEGFIYVAEVPRQISFVIRRVYVISDIIPLAVRGRHTHRQTEQVLFCLSGSVDVILDNGRVKKTVTVSDPSQGIYLPPLLWHEMVNFRNNPILLVLASEIYDEADYIRNYGEFKTLAGKKYDLHE